LMIPLNSGSFSGNIASSILSPLASPFISTCSAWMAVVEKPESLWFAAAHCLWPLTSSNCPETVVCRRYLRAEFPVMGSRSRALPAR
jgi:hypothetical protein